MPQQRFDTDKEEEVGLLQDASPIVTCDSTLESVVEPPSSPAPKSPSRRRVVLGLAAALLLVSLVSFLTTYLLIPRGPPPPSYRDLFHLPPREPVDANWTFGTAPVGNHTVTCIILHGLGDDRNILPFRRTLPESDYPYVKWVVPQGRWFQSTVNGNATVKGWYNIQTFNDLHLNEDEAGLIESQRQVNLLIREEREILRAQGKEPRIALAGFSQGAVMTLLNVLSSVEKIDVAIVLSGYLALPGKVELLAPEAPRDTPIFWGHGMDDPILTEEHAAEDAEALVKPPFSFTDLTFKTYPHIQHYWSQEEMADMTAFFRKNVPEKRA